MIAALAAALNAFAGDTKNVCIKNGSEIAVSGKSDAEMKQACEDAGGTWTAKKAKSGNDDGGGGGW
jgi:hypothetical protein